MKIRLDPHFLSIFYRSLYSSVRINVHVQTLKKEIWKTIQINKSNRLEKI